MDIPSKWMIHHYLSKGFIIIISKAVNIPLIRYNMNGTFKAFETSDVIIEESFL